MHKNVKKILFTEAEIIARSTELGAAITNDYRDRERPPLLVALLRGSVPFLAELIKHIDLDIQYDFMDVTKAECYFDTPEFISLLEFVNWKAISTRQSFHSTFIY